ncbi:hypothetical protein Y032_0002g523 [Ancylostoma ceylanicum]|nr:hypothetical protein Y032_0002g523 [Ancylostoma ceylanicum]
MQRRCLDSLVSSSLFTLKKQHHARCNSDGNDLMVVPQNFHPSLDPGTCSCPFVCVEKNVVLLRASTERQPLLGSARDPGVFFYFRTCASNWLCLIKKASRRIQGCSRLECCRRSTAGVDQSRTTPINVTITITANNHQIRKECVRYATSITSWRLPSLVLHRVDRHRAMFDARVERQPGE